MVYSHNSLQDAPLAVLAHRINQHQETLDGYTRNRLQVAIDQGDVLRWAKARVGARRWKEYRQENCPKVAERTDALHRRLAAHRARIEQELATNPDLGVVEAVKLISTPKPPKANVVLVEQKISADERASKTTPTETAALVATAVAAEPTMPVPVPIKTHPMTDANRAAVIGLALQALSVSRRPVSAPNNEIVQGLLSEIIKAVKTVTQPAKPPVLDETLLAKAMGLAA